MKYRSLLKSELAAIAGISTATLRRWMLRHSNRLETMGVTAKTKILPPSAVRFICEEYGIDVADA